MHEADRETIPMAGDWIKMRVALHDDPAVIAMADRLGIEDADLIVGKLYRFWAWADSHTSTGENVPVTPRWVNRFLAVPGFAEAMQEAGWLKIGESSITFPAFEKHNGKSAKLRSDAALRQKKHRSAGNVTDSCDKSVTREEKSREEKSRGKPPLPPLPQGLANSPEFVSLWASWVAHRKEKRSPLTSNAAAQQLKKLEEWGPQRAIAALTSSLANGYTGVFEDKNGVTKPGLYNGIAAFVARGEPA